MFPHTENTSRHARGPTGSRTAGKYILLPQYIVTRMTK